MEKQTHHHVHHHVPSTIDPKKQEKLEKGFEKPDKKHIETIPIEEASEELRQAKILAQRIEEKEKSKHKEK